MDYQIAHVNQFNLNLTHRFLNYFLTMTSALILDIFPRNANQRKPTHKIRIKASEIIIRWFNYDGIRYKEVATMLHLHGMQE